MPTVPIYERDQRLDPAYTQGINVSVNADMFGAATARGMQDIAKGINDVSTVAFGIEKLKADTKRRETLVDFKRETQQLQVDLMSTEGMSAQGAGKAWEEKSREIQKKLAENLKGAALDDFMIATEGDIISAGSSILGHEASQIKSGMDQSFVSLTDTYAENAIKFWSNPKQRDAEIQGGLSVIAQRGEAQGWTADTVQNIQSQFLSDTYNNIALSIAQTDPLGAQAFADEHKDEFTGGTYVDLTSKLKPAVQLKQASDAAAGFWENMVTANNGVNVEANTEAANNTFIRLQQAWGKPLTITSGFRDPKKNASVDGVPKSEHLEGNAFDVDVSSMSIEDRKKLIIAARQAGFGGVGIYKDSMHFDIGSVRAWGETKKSDSIPDWALGALATTASAPPEQGGAAPAAAPQSALPFMDPMAIEAHVQGLPADVQDATRKMIYGQFETINKAQDYNRQVAQQSLWDTVVQTKQMPTDPGILMAAGNSAVSAAQTYLEKGGNIATDQQTYYDLTQLRASDPKTFADPTKTNLLDYRAVLSQSDWKAFADSQAEMGGKGDQTNYNTAFDLSKSMVEAAIGLMPSRTDKPEEAQAYQERVNQFNADLLAEMQRYKEATKGQEPGQAEIYKMAAALLLPTVRTNVGMLYNSEESGFAFQMDMPGMEGFTLDAAKIVPTISMDVRAMIEQELKSEGVTKPTDDDIARRYAYYLSMSAATN